MLSVECIDAYRVQYPNEDCGYCEPDDRIIVGPEDRTYIEPLEGETDKIFLDRLKRSREAGRNLFYEEWDPFEYEAGCIY